MDTVTNSPSSPTSLSSEPEPSPPATSPTTTTTSARTSVSLILSPTPRSPSPSLVPPSPSPPTTTTSSPTTTTTTTISIPASSFARVVPILTTIKDGAVIVIFPTDHTDNPPLNDQTGVIAGSIVGSLAFLLAVAGVFIYMYRRRNKSTSGFSRKIFKSNNHFNMGTLHPNAAQYNSRRSSVIGSEDVSKRSSVSYNGFVVADSSVTPIMAPGFRQSIFVANQPAYVIDPRTGETYLSSNGQLPEGFQYLDTSNVQFTPIAAPVVFPIQSPISNQEVTSEEDQNQTDKSNREDNREEESPKIT